MGKPGAKKTDQIVSVTPGDVHIIMIPSPGGPVPTPIPHPCASIIKDNVATKVKVMGQPGAVKGSKSKHTPPHIPMGPGPFQKPPKNEGEIITGSANVFYEDKEAAMLGDTGQMCSDPSDTPVGKVIGTAATVLIGGGGGGSDEAREKASADAMKAASAACHKWINNNMPPGADREQAHRDVCTATGHPIDVATGKVFTKAVEIVLKGRLPLEIVRNYSSARSDRGALGISWRHSLEIELIEGREFTALRDENGRFIPFAPVARNQRASAALGRFTLTRDADGNYTVHLKNGSCYRFGRPREGRGETLTMALVAIEDTRGNRAFLRHDDAGRLVSLTDSAGRVVFFGYNADGLMSELRLQETAQSPAGPVLCRYFYSNDLLVAVEDLAGNRWTYEYQRHLLVRETDRNGDAFYFRYDKDDWCVETWGDQGLLHRRLQYDRPRGRTRVIDGLGYSRTFEWNEKGIVASDTDHRGNSLRFRYNDFMECVEEENGLGHKWTYAYDEAGRMVAMENAGGAALAFAWDERGRLTEKVDANGGTWTWAYDDASRSVLVRNPLGEETVETRDERGDLVKIRAADGREVRFTYDAAGNCIQMINGDGLHLQRVFNDMGDLVREIDQYGTRLETEYDGGGFPKFVRLRGRGESQFERDAEGRITRVKTSRGRCYEYDYLPFLPKVTRMRQVSGATLADGRRVVPERCYTYDTEARLTRLEIDGERKAEYSYAQHNGPMRISYSDGREQIFERDARGNIVRLIENGELVFTQQIDPSGRVAQRVTGDGETFSFEYDGAGNFLAGTASRDTQPIALERDELGRVVAQGGAAGDFSFAYDPIGRCAGYRFGEDLAIGLAFQRNAGPGRALSVSVNERSVMRFTFDGRERLTTAAFTDGDRHEYRYAEGYSPRERMIFRGDREILREQFDFDAAGLPVRHTKSDGTVKAWDRDEKDRLVTERDEQRGVSSPQECRWGYDIHGDRVLATARSDAPTRITFVGHRPVACGDERYGYDRRGRVVTRTDAAGAVTRFHWNSLSQLRQVDLPDGRIVEYDYDVLGRRVAKRAGEEVRRFGWIDNQLVHEQARDGNETHYFYQPGSFAPISCVRRESTGTWRCDAVTTDYRGAPTVVTAPGGREIWRANVAAWGQREVQLSSVAMPLGIPGQYEDEETGLFYNNARYYNPVTATYLTPDPIGLAGAENCYQYVTDPLSTIDPLGLNPENIALGLSSYDVPLPNGRTARAPDVLQRFANDPAGDGSVRATTWTGFDPVIDPNTGCEKGNFGPRIRNAMGDAKQIHFNLEGIGNDPNRATVEQIMANPDPKLYKPPSTEWELMTILNDPDLRGKTTFYDGPGVVSKRIPCG